MSDSFSNPRAEATKNKNVNNEKEENEKVTVFTKLVDIVLYPFKQVLQATRIRMDAHLYIEVQLPFVHLSIKFCILTIWIILYMIHNKN